MWTEDVFETVLVPSPGGRGLNLQSSGESRRDLAGGRVTCLLSLISDLLQFVKFCR